MAPPLSLPLVSSTPALSGFTGVSAQAVQLRQDASPLPPPLQQQQPAPELVPREPTLAAAREPAVSAALDQALSALGQAVPALGQAVPALGQASSAAFDKASSAAFDAAAGQVVSPAQATEELRR